MDENRHGSVRERLLRTADELFYREGIHTVGIDRILEQAGVAKASLYGTFGSKDGLVRAYLQGRAARLQDRIEKRVAGADSARGRILAVFDQLIDRVGEGAYYGCAFARACAEGPREPGVARETAAHRAWRHALFMRLLKELGARDAEGTSRQLSLIYDGASASVAMDEDPRAALAARKAVEKLLDQQQPARRQRKSARRIAK